MNAPVVSVVDFATVLLGTPLQVAELFTVTDPDGDAITSYEFTDLSGAPLTGRFRAAGSLQANGSTVQISASQLGSFQYIGGGDVSNELIRIRAFDGQDFSVAQTVRIYSTTQNNTRPVITAEPSFVLENEFRLGTALLSASDPDGFPIQRFFLRDRRVDGSFFTLNGERLQEGVYHNVQTEDLVNLRYFGFGSGTDIIDAFAWDGSDWSVASSETIRTIANTNRPSVQFNRKEVGANTTTTFADLLVVSDVDGNTPKFVELFDTGPHSFTGALVFNGQELESKVWHRFAYSDIDQITYNAAERTHSEQIRVRVSDGQFLSRNATVIIDSVESPVVGHDDLIPLSHLEFVPLREIFAQNDNGTSYIEYEIIELGGVTGDATGRLLTFGDRQPTGEVISLTPAEFQNTGFRSGAFVERATDELLIRARNNQFWGDWSRVTLRTEPAGQDALLQVISTTPTTYNSWLQYTTILTPERAPNEITFSFMQNFPIYDPEGEAAQDNFFTLTAQERENVRVALREYSSFANVTFTEISDATINDVTGDRGGLLRFGSYEEFPSNILGYTFLPSFAPEAGDIFLNIALVGGDWTPGTPGYETLIHEIGHAMGFEHPFAGQAPFLPDSTQTSDYTVMANQPSINGIVGAYQIYDVYQAQQLYGAAANNTGDDLYDENSFYNGANSVQTIWDTGGIDTLSAAGTATTLPFGATLDLREGARSSIGTFTENITINFGVQIENAIGTARADSITGNALNNTLTGGLGADQLYGLGGNDLLQGGAGDDTYLWGIGDGSDTISEERLAGRDTISIVNTPGVDNFEEDLQFRLDGRDLVVDLNLGSEGASVQSLRIENQRWGSWRIESLEIGGSRVDLTDVFRQASAETQNFRILNSTSIFGSLVVPT